MGVEHQAGDDVKRDENYGSHYGVSSVEMKPVDKYIRNATENQKENSGSVSALFLPSWHIVSLCPANAGDSFFILLFFLSATT